MGKGTIISGGTDGQYQVSVIYNTDRAQAEKTANLAKIANLETQIAEETDDQKLNILKLQKLSLEKRNEVLDAIPESETITAWCADLTEDLTGDVGLIEVPGESVAFNIQPGHEDNAVYDSDRDGQLFPTMAMTPAAAFYNLAMLPGWQKWKPTYRYGTITAIDGDLADVALEEAESSQQALEINQASGLLNVPIEYMGCNGAAFDVDDEVLVKFTGQDWDSPTIIGFKQNPVACCVFEEYFLGLDVYYAWNIIGTTPDNYDTFRRAVSGTFAPNSTHTDSITENPDHWLLSYSANGSVIRFVRDSTTPTCVDGSLRDADGETLYHAPGNYCRCRFETNAFDHGVSVPFTSDFWLVLDMDLTQLEGAGPLVFDDDVYLQARLKFYDGSWSPGTYGAETDLKITTDGAGRKRYATNVKTLFNSYYTKPQMSVMLYAYFPTAEDRGCGGGYLALFSSDPGPMTYEFEAKVYSITLCAATPPEDAIIF